MRDRGKRLLWLALALLWLQLRRDQRAAAQGTALGSPDAGADVTVSSQQEASPQGEAAQSALQSAPPPAPLPAPSLAAKISEVLGLRAYGFVKPTVIVANGIESFGNPNYVATTAAVNPLFLPNPDAVAVSFQVQQTRLGLVVGEGYAVKAQVEIDFVDFSKSSPAQASPPRLRQAIVEWAINEHHKLTLGQLWDVFAPLNTHSYDVVATLFQSGNAGFMRHQLIYTASYGRLEGLLALGLTNQNLQSGLNNVEYGRMPTIVLRGSYKVDKQLWVGAAGMISRVSFDATLPSESTRIAAGGNLFADMTFGDLNLRAEAYAGQNLNNLGMLVLSQGNAGASVSEVGGFVSGKYTFLANHAAHLTAGVAYLLDPEDLSFGYTPAVPPMGATPAVNALRVAANGPGIEHNLTLRVGYSYSPYKSFALIAEPFVMFTRHKLDPAASARFDADRLGYGVLFGGLYSFGS
jgi:hypothetical protein